MSNPKFKMQKIKVAGGAFTFPLETSIVQKIVWKDLIEVFIYHHSTLNLWQWLEKSIKEGIIPDKKPNKVWLLSLNFLGVPSFRVPSVLQ